MKSRMTLALILAAIPLTAVYAMPVSTFLAKADALQKKGPLALFSRDLKLLTAQVKADAAELRRERLAAKAAGRPQAFCPPEGGIKLTDRDIMDAMRQVPPAHRARTGTKAALKAHLAKRNPCT